MTAQNRAVAAGLGRFLRPGVVVLAAALVVGVAAGLLIANSRSRPRVVPMGAPAPAAPQVTWAAGARPAPDFSLTDQAGEPISLRRFHGRPVIVTFIDPLCRNLCPLEAKVLERVESSLPPAQRPAIVAVSVNQWGNKRSYLLEDMSKWKLRTNWHWAVGSVPALAKVWRDYKIGVQDAPKTVAGVTVHNIEHTEASYVLDAQGNERALFLYPFVASDVARTVKQLAGA